MMSNKSAKSGGKTDKHNKEVKEGNINFSTRLLEKAKKDDYEDSSASSDNQDFTP